MPERPSLALPDSPFAPSQRVAFQAISDPATHRITLRPRRIALGLLLLVGMLTLLHSVARIAILTLPDGEYLGAWAIAQRLDFDHEHTLPAWCSSLMLLASAGFLALIARDAQITRKGFPRHWQALAVIFVYLAIDESVSLHEISSTSLQQRLATTGVFFFAWVIPALVGVGLFLLAYVRFLRHLPRRTGALMILSGGVYVGGALGMEMLGGAIAEVEGWKSPRYSLIMTVEELLEMLGVVLFLYTLLDYLAATANDWHFQVRPT